MVSTELSANVGECRLVIRPNRSLSWRESLLFIAAVGALLMLVSLAFALQGYWLILPFAGLEVAALTYCTWRVMQAGYRCEVVSMDAAQVVIEKGRQGCGQAPSGGPQSSVSFPRAWTRVELRSRGSWYPDRLVIGASGNYVELGAFLADDEKRQLAVDLDRMLAITPSQ